MAGQVTYSEDSQNPPDEDHVKRFEHQAIFMKELYMFQCADGFSKVLDRTSASSFVERNLEHEEEDKVQRHTSGARVDNFIHGNHEEPRAKLCVPDDDTFPIPVKHVKVTRQKKSDIKNLSKCTLKDLRSHAHKSLIFPDPKAEASRKDTPL